jgi:hypothetical protein
MNAIRTKMALAMGLVVALLLGGCGGSGDPAGCGSPTEPCPPPPSSPIPTSDSTPAPTPAPAALDVSGGWHSQARSWNFRLEQNGTTLTGVVLGYKNVSYDQTDPLVQITGSISASGEVAFNAPVFGVEFSGTADPNGILMTGTLRDCANGCRNYGEVLDRK